MNKKLHGIKSIIVISFLDPRRIGGPQVDVPGDFALSGLTILESFGFKASPEERRVKLAYGKYLLCDDAYLYFVIFFNW